MHAKITGIENRIDLGTKAETLVAVLQLPDGTELRANISPDIASYIIQNTMTAEPARPTPPAPRAPTPQAPQAPRESFTLEAEAPVFGGDFEAHVPEEADDYSRPPAAAAEATPWASQAPPQRPAWDPRQGPPPVRTIQKDDAGNPQVAGRRPRQQFDGDEDGVPSV